MKVDFDYFTDELVKSFKPSMSYDGKEDVNEYKKRIRAKFEELFCINKIKENACELNIDIEEVIDKGTYTQTRFTLETEKNNFMPCYLLMPKDNKETHDVAIVLQGHTTGMHVSIGEVRFEGDDKFSQWRAAIEAVENGFAAIAMELRGMGEQKAMRPNRQWENGGKCKYPASTAFLLGRTLEGERIWDVSRLIDVLPKFKGLNPNKILITGCSGGGTLTYYAACYDERITMAAPDCAYCPYKESILAMFHCACNYIPHAYEYFDMQDLSCLIAPRKLLILAGKEDPIFPIEGVDRGYKTTKAIYENAGCIANLDLVKTNGKHAWIGSEVWPAIMRMWNK